MLPVTRVRTGPAQRRAGERGQSLVEVALVAPVLLLVLLGAVQLALVVHVRGVVTAAVQEGARYAAAEGRMPADGVTRAQAVLDAGVNRAEAPFTVTARSSGETVVVEAEGRYRLLFPWVTGRSLPIAATAEVRREGFRGGP